MRKTLPNEADFVASIRYVRHGAEQPHLPIGTAQLIDTVELFLVRALAEEIGATEAALIAALSGVEDAKIVVPAVFLYRLVTFWLPILPGWFALTYLRRTDKI